MNSVDDTLNPPAEVDTKEPLEMGSVDCLEMATCLPTRLGHALGSRSNGHVVVEAGDKEEESAPRPEPVSVKSTAAFKFWTTYLTDCGAANEASPRDAGTKADRHNNETPNLAGTTTCQPSCHDNIKRFVDPTSVDNLLEQNIDMACFRAEEAEQDDNEGTAVTPRVSCSTEIQGGVFHQGYKLAATLNCRPNDEQVMELSDKAKPGESQRMNVEKGLEPDHHTLSSRSSGFDPSALTVQTANDEHHTTIAAEGIPTPANASRCNAEPSPTFTHYTLLIPKGSADSDDIFAALSESTIGSERDLKVPISTLSATTFLSSPSASSTCGSLAQAFSTGSAIPDAGPISAKSTSSTIASSCSISTSERDGSNRSCKNNASQDSSLPTSRAYSFAEEEVCPVVNRERLIRKVNATGEASPEPFATERHEGSAISVSNSEGKGKDSFERAVPEATTDITAQETMLSSETMAETIVSEVTDPTMVPATASALGSSISEDDPYEWAYEVWRFKGLLSELASKGNRQDGPVVRQQGNAKQPRTLTLPLIHPEIDNSRSLSNKYTKKSLKTKQTEESFYSILQRWRSKSSDFSNEEQEQDLSSKNTINMISKADSKNTHFQAIHETFLVSNSSAAEKGDTSSKSSNAVNSTKTQVKSLEESCLVSISSAAEIATSSTNASKISKLGIEKRRSSSIDESSRVSVSSANERVPASPKTIEVFSPFIPRSPRPVLLKSPSSPSPSVISNLVKTRSSEKPPLPLCELGKSKDPETLMGTTSANVASPLQQATSKVVNKRCDNVTRQSENGILVFDNISTDQAEQSQTRMTARECKVPDLTARPLSNLRPSKNLPKSHGNYKAVVQSLLHGVENNGLEILKSFSSKSDEDNRNLILDKPSDSSVEVKPCSDFDEVIDENTSQVSKSQDLLIVTSGILVEEADVGPSYENQLIDSFCGTAKSKSANGNVSKNNLDMLDTRSTSQQTTDRPRCRLSSHVQHSPTESVPAPRNVTRRCSMRSFMSPNRESTSLNLGESLVGKTIEVRSSSKATPSRKLNESTGSGSWVRLLSCESDQLLDSDEDIDAPGRRGQSHAFLKGASPQAHAWRRDIAIRQVNSYDGDFSIRSSFEDSQPCQCASSVFSGRDELVEFYLPLMGMACSCGARANSSRLRNPEEPTSLENILRTWQTEYLASFGIYRGDQLVKAFHRSGPALAKAMRRYRKKHGMTSFPSKSCGMALSIWTKTSKAFVRSIRKQLTTGVADGIKIPNTLYILSSFLDKIPLDGAAAHRPEVVGKMPTNSIPSEECSL